MESRMVEINTFADNKLVLPEKIKDWEKNRHLRVSKSLRGSSNSSAGLIQSDSGLEEQKRELAYFKIAMGEEEIRKRLRLHLELSRIFLNILSFLSFGKRKFSVVEIVMNGVDLSPSEFIRRSYIMQNEGTEYNVMRLKSCADHYILGMIKDGVQEVIETTGGSPLPIQFFIRYDDEEGMKSKMDPSYDLQLVGVARTKNGTILGAIRHQVRKESNGLRLQALVEFPVLIPDYMIKQHQYHLMCEFNNWVRDVINMDPTV
ncbi:hypothetical protein BGZ46_002004 [Entomortierella lignicola]|nr:hypothetical protein BGZ46_002004 [Entomortierella lignicola]